MSEKGVEKRLETFKLDGKWLESCEVVKELNVNYARSCADFT